MVRIWQLSPDEILTRDLALLPLAPITDVPPGREPEIIERMRARLAAEAAPISAEAELWASTLLLMGLRYPRETASQLLKGVRTMWESSTYRGIYEDAIEKGLAQGMTQGMQKGIAQGIQQGTAQGERHLLLLLGTKRLGEPDAHIRAVLEQIESPQRLDALALRLLDVQSWQELLEDDAIKS